tara:strand:+ start:58 stop:345 length:288 start_codon:yes stop_codon:yes gene_type:complete
MRRLFLAQLLFFIATGSSTPLIAADGYWLVIGSYRQGPGGRPEVSGITSPSLFAIPMKTIEQCENAGAKITEDIYKPVWQFDNQWTCVEGETGFK